MATYTSSEHIIRKAKRVEIGEIANTTGLVFAFMMWISIIGALYYYFTSQPNIFEMVMLSSVVLYSSLMLFVLMTLTKKKTSANTGDLTGEIANRGDKKFYMNMGYILKEHFHNPRKNIEPENIERPLLIGQAELSRHGSVSAGSGGGKTVFLIFMAIQQLKQGGGFMLVDGKGDKFLQRTMYTLMWLFGRQNDFMYINFNDPNDSMSFSLFDMKREIVLEVFKMMLTAGSGGSGGDEWKKKGITLMRSYLSAMLTLKEMGLVVRAEDFENINTYEDLKAHQHENTLTFMVINEMFNINDLIKFTRMCQRIYDNDSTGEFRKDVVKASFQEKRENVNQRELHFALTQTLMKQAQSSKEEILSASFEQLEKKDRWAYSVNVAVDFWTQVFDLFTDDFNTITNSSTPDINFIDVVLRSKVLYISLPGTDSQATKAILANILVSQISAIFKKVKDASKMKIPFVVFFDEFNSYSAGLPGVGDLIAQLRGVKIAIWVLFQADLGNIDDGKGLEAEKINANFSIKIVLRTESEKLVELYQKAFPKKRFIEEVENFDYHRSKTDSDVKANMNYKEEPMFTFEDAKRLAPGECYINIADRAYKAQAGYLKITRYEESFEQAVPVANRYPKKKLLREMDKMDIAKYIDNFAYKIDDIDNTMDYKEAS